MTAAPGLRSTGPRPQTPSTHARVCLIGSFEAHVSGHAIRMPASAQRLVAFLALQDRSLPRHFVWGTLWPEANEERAAGNLRSSLWRLREAGEPLVETTNHHVRLGRTVVVDVNERVALIREALGSTDGVGDGDLAQIAADADLLPGWYEDWVSAERERFRQLRLHGLERLCAALAERGRFAEAVEMGLAAVRSEPLRESAQRALIRAYLAEGNPSEAVRQFQRFRVLLRAEMGLEPSVRLEELLADRAAS